MKTTIHHPILRVALSVVMLASIFVVSSCNAPKNAQSAETIRVQNLDDLDWNDHRTANLTLTDGKYYTPDGIPYCWCEKCRDTARKYHTKYLSQNDVKVVTGYKYSSNPSRLVRIEPGKNDTRVTLAIQIYHDANWLFASAGTYLLDHATGDKYMIHDIEGGQELGRMNVVNGLRGKFVEQTLIFPPLKKGVTMVDLYEPENYGTEALPDNGTKGEPTRIRNIKIADWTPRPQGEVIRL